MTTREYTVHGQLEAAELHSRSTESEMAKRILCDTRGRPFPVLFPAPVRLVENRAGYAGRHEPRAEQDAAKHPCVSQPRELNRAAYRLSHSTAIMKHSIAGAAWCAVAVTPEQCLDNALDGCAALRACGAAGSGQRGAAQHCAVLAERCSRVLVWFGTRVALHGVDVQTVERLVARSYK